MILCPAGRLTFFLAPYHSTGHENRPARLKYRFMQGLVILLAIDQYGNAIGALHLPAILRRFKKVAHFSIGIKSKGKACCREHNHLRTAQ